MSLRTFDYTMNGKSLICVFRMQDHGKFDLVEIVERPLGISIMKEVEKTEHYGKIWREAEKKFGGA